MKKWIRPWDPPLPRAEIGLLGFALLASSVIGLWLGSRDLFMPSSTTGQLVGLAFSLAGLAGLAGVAGLRGIRAPLMDQNRWFGRQHDRTATYTGRIARVFGGAAGGAYIDVTIAAYAYRYRPVEAIIFGVLAVLCLFLAAVIRPAFVLVWPNLSGGLKGLGVLAGALGLFAQFWYSGVYVPKNTQVGINYSLTLGPVVRSGRDTLVTIQLTMENESSLSAVILGSMIEVSGASYTPGAGPARLPATAIQQKMTRYAKLERNPDIGFQGHERDTVLSIQSLIDNNALLLPGVTYAKDFVVVVPASHFAALQVATMVYYARQTRLRLGPGARLTNPVPVAECLPKYVTTWGSPVREGALRSFATGPLHLYSSWCAKLNRPFIAQTIGASATPEPTAVESALQAHFGPIHNVRDETFALEPPAAAAQPSR